MAEINVTPLIDVVLVLLVVFMVITPMLKSGKEVDLPLATQAEGVKDTSVFIIVAITADGQWWVEQTAVSEDDLIATINDEFNKRPKSTLLVKADRSLQYQDVREVLDELAKNRWTAVQIATAKEG
ncbi:MAG: ExbD/TolR family protein [Myxococcota bacterium]